MSGDRSDDSMRRPLAEYEALRSEILNSFDGQQGLYLFQFAATGVVLSFVLSDASRAPSALILPFVSYLLGFRYIQTSLGVIRISFQIERELSPRVSGGFGWERWNRGELSTIPEAVIPHLSGTMFIGPAVLGVLVGLWGIVAGPSRGAVEVAGLVALASASSALVVLLAGC